MEHIIRVGFGYNREAVSEHRYQYDYGQLLQFRGLDLPTAYEVHFSNDMMSGTSKTAIGNADGVLIPDEFFLSGEDVYAWLFLHDEVTDGRTMYKLRIPIKKRPRPIDTEPTPVQQDVITQAIAALNDAVERTDTSAEEANTAAQSAQENAELTENYRDEVIAARDVVTASEANVIRLAEDVEADAAGAAQSALEAAQSADRAEQVASTAGYMFFYIDEHGDLIYQRTSNTHVDFYLSDGDLYVRANA